MRYLKFRERNTDVNTKTIGVFKRVLLTIMKFIFSEANPDFDNKIDSVSIWLLEFEDKEDYPNREIGLNYENNPIVKMPYKRNYGYWTDNNLMYEDFIKLFNAEPISESEFSKKWDELN